MNSSEELREPRVDEPGEEPLDKGRRIAGWTMAGVLIVGWASLPLTFAAAFAGHWEGAGLSLLAGAFAFGLGANAVFRR